MSIGDRTILFLLLIIIPFTTPFFSASLDSRCLRTVGRGSANFVRPSFTMTGTVDRTLEDMGITLPEVKPAGNYELFTRSGSTLFLSGHLPKTNEGELIKGKVGEDIDVGKAAEAAKVVAVNLIATIKAACGDLDKVRILKITGFVNSGADFTSQPLVVNGASDMLVSIFGKEKGAHARSAVGVGSLPFGVCVEIEAIIEVLP